MSSPTTTPAQAWREMVRGNERFIAGSPRHPRQDVDRRGELIGTQAPHATLFGCSDSRLAAEIIFDKGLGDLFVIRNAGQVISESVIGSLEYAVAVLGVPLIVVLGHDECGAVRAAIDSQAPDAVTISPHITHLIEPITRSVKELSAHLGHGEQPDATVVGRHHLRSTITEMVAGSELISDAVASGTLAIVGANYELREGRAVRDIVVGDIGES